MSVQLGDRVRAKLNGFEGIAAVISDHLHGCRQVYIKPEKLTKEGKPLDGIWVDEPWVEIVKAGVHKKTAPFEVVDGKKKRTAGPEGVYPSESRQPE